MYAKVTVQFPPRLGGGIKRKGDWRISKFYSKIGRGGGIVRGRGQVCGGCGGHHSGYNRHNPAISWFHGVDFSDFRSRFSGE